MKRVDLTKVVEQYKELANQIALLETQKGRLGAEAKQLKIRQQYVELKIAYWQAVATSDKARIKTIAEQAQILAKQLKI